MSMKVALAVAPENALMSAFVVFRDKLEVSIDKAARLGYDGVELALLNKNQVDLKAVKKMLSDTGLEIPMVSTGQIFADTGVNFMHPEKDKRKKALEDFFGLMEAAAELGSQVNIGRLRGYLQEGQSSLDYFREAMIQALERADELDVTIALEPVNRYEINFLNNCDETANILRELGHPRLMMMPDVFHMNIEDSSIEGSFWKYADMISYVHFADSNRWAPGRGHLDFRCIVSALRQIAYDGYVSLEILPFPDPDQAAAEAISTIRKYI